MIRFKLRTKRGELVGLGLTAKNLELLREGKPIHFDGVTCGVPGYEFAIMYGETEQAIVDQLRSSGVALPSLEFTDEGEPVRTQIWSPEGGNVKGPVGA
jgi:hypothetical protein